MSSSQLASSRGGEASLIGNILEEQTPSSSTSTTTPTNPTTTTAASASASSSATPLRPTPRRVASRDDPTTNNGNGARRTVGEGTQEEGANGSAITADSSSSTSSSSSSSNTTATATALSSILDSQQQSHPSHFLRSVLGPGPIQRATSAPPQLNMEGGLHSNLNGGIIDDAHHAESNGDGDANEPGQAATDHAGFNTHSHGYSHAPFHQHSEPFVLNGETIQPDDQRLTQEYYTYYFSQRPLDPRLPPPLVNWSNMAVVRSPLVVPGRTIASTASSNQNGNGASALASSTAASATIAPKQQQHAHSASTDAEDAETAASYDSLKGVDTDSPALGSVLGATLPTLSSLDAHANNMLLSSPTSTVGAGTYSDAASSVSPGAAGSNEESLAERMASASLASPHDGSDSMSTMLGGMPLASSAANLIPSYLPHMSPHLTHTQSHPPAQLLTPQGVGYYPPQVHPAQIAAYFSQQQHHQQQHPQQAYHPQQNYRGGAHPSPMHIANLQMQYQMMQANNPGPNGMIRGNANGNGNAAGGGANPYAPAPTIQQVQDMYMRAGYPAYQQPPQQQMYGGGGQQHRGGGRHQHQNQHMPQFQQPHPPQQRGGGGGRYNTAHSSNNNHHQQLQQQSQTQLPHPAHLPPPPAHPPAVQQWLDEFRHAKSTSGYTLNDIVSRGVLLDLAMDQHGSRFIQQRLELCDSSESDGAYVAISPLLIRLSHDVFGNYVVQKFFEHGTIAQRREMCHALRGHILTLTLQMYGCRVIQKALDCTQDDVDTQQMIISELDGHVMQCVRDQNGNHCIQKCIERVPPHLINWIIDTFQHQIFSLSIHPYGCRVVQRLLEHCTEQSRKYILDEIIENVDELCRNQFGNYVIQHILKSGSTWHKQAILSVITGIPISDPNKSPTSRPAQHGPSKVHQMSKHKYASNVIEECFAHGGSKERMDLIDQILGKDVSNNSNGTSAAAAAAASSSESTSSPFLSMVKDQYGNYVIQKLLDEATPHERAIMIERIRKHGSALRRVPFGKHIVSKIEKLTDRPFTTPEEEMQSSTNTSGRPQQQHQQQSHPSSQTNTPTHAAIASIAHPSQQHQSHYSQQHQHHQQQHSQQQQHSSQQRNGNGSHSLLVNNSHNRR